MLTKIPDELWLFVASNLCLDDLLSLCQCGKHFYPLLQSLLKTQFAQLCPWYEQEVTLDALLRYFSSTELEVQDLSTPEVDTPLPDDFESFLGGQRSYVRRNFSHYCFELDKRKRRKLLKGLPNDRGMQLDDRLVYFTESQLPWNKGDRLVLDQGSFSVRNVSCKMQQDMYSQDYTVHISEQLAVLESDLGERDALGYVVKHLTGKSAAHSKPDMVLTAPHPLAYRKTDTILCGSHLFYERCCIASGDRSLYHVNGKVDLKLPKTLATSSDFIVRSMLAYKGKFYIYLADEFLIEATRVKDGQELLTKSLGHLPGFKKVRQDERYPRYLYCVPYGKNPWSLIDLDKQILYKIHGDEDWFPMPGVTDGKLKCFFFSDDFIKARWEKTETSEEHEWVV